MYNPITCPKCGATINLENEDYINIVNQIRTEEFNSELEKRVDEEKRHQAEAIQLAESNVRLEMQKELSEKDKEILELNKRNEDLTNKAVIAVRKHEEELNKLRVSSGSEITRLQEQLNVAEERQKMAISNAITEERERLQEKDVEIARLQELINTTIADAKLEATSIGAQKDQEISELNAKIVSINASYAARETANEEKFRAQLKAKEEEVQFYKDFKAKLNTKLIGETLEEHCYAEYAKIRPLMPNSMFEKDNSISESRSKGDFIFRDYDDGGDETVSIMFEMKNQAEESQHKHKNSDFYKELDKDRREKGCEYAILVSTLESDSELFNQGIVDVSDKYEKMFVIRPQFFLPMITLLRNAAQKSINYRKELEEYKAMRIDVTTFEADLAAFKESIFKSSEQARKNKDTAIERIDKAIQLLQAVKDELGKFDTHLQQAANKAEKVTVKKLSDHAPAIAAEFKKIEKPSLSRPA